MLRIRQVKSLFIVVSVALLCALPFIVSAAQNISEGQWRTLTSDKAFFYKDKKEIHKQLQQGLQQNPFSRFAEWIIKFFSSPMGKTIIWAFIFTGIAYVFLKVFFGEKTGLFKREQKQLESENLSDSLQPEDILSTDWEKHLQQAVGAGDMRSAIRFSYLQLLQFLQKQHLINYKADKTNHDYYYEIANTDIKRSFRKLSRQYEYAWYGDYPVQKTSYDDYMNDFNSLKKQFSER